MPLGMPSKGSLGNPLGRATSSISTSSGPVRGEAIFALPGTFTWTCPTGVTSVSVVCVGPGGASASLNYNPGAGGALAWANDIPVTPGQGYTVTVGRSTTNGSQASSVLGVTANGGSAMSGVTNGATYSFSTPASLCVRGGGNGGGINDPGGHGSLGGAGAGGYTGNGGNTNPRTEGSGENNAGNSGSGGGGGAAGSGGGGGGGVGIYGAGSNGTGGPANGGSGGGGSGGSNGLIDGTTGGNGTYGGGARSGNLSMGGPGVVRIIWPGSTRQFPSTDVGTP